MKVTIIIPIYNVSEYITRCLESVSKQTYSDIECILIDDCGTDTSMEIADNYINQKTDSIHFRIIHHDHNQGLSAARNTGIDNATGDYIFFLDSDDSITPDCIEIMAKLANKYPQAAYVQGNTVTKGESLMSHQYKCIAPEYCDNKEELEELILSKTLTTAWNKLLKRSFIIDHSLYFPTGIVIEDTYWSYFLAKYSSAVAFTNERTYYYFKNNNSIINAKSKSMNDKRIQGLFSGFNAIFEDMKKEKKASKQQRVYLASNIVICMSRISSFSQWLTFWKLTTRMFNTARKQITRYQFLLYISTMPPLCFLSKWNGWTWRLNQKLSCHV